MSIFELPIDIRFNILALLPLPDLLNFCKSNSECAKVINSEKFWLRKLVLDFPAYVKLKPQQRKSKEWYQRIYQSGDAYMVDDPHETKSTFIASNVWKCFYVDFEVIFYIDIFNTLYLIARKNLPKNLALGHWKELIPSFESKEFRNIKLQENVIDFYIGKHFTAYLSTDGILSTTGCHINDDNDGFVPKVRDIKKILSNGEESVCLLLDNENNLLWLDDATTLDKIDSNVTSAAVDWNDDYAVIYYVKKGGLWEFYPKPIVKTKTLKTPSCHPTDCKSKAKYVYNLLFEQDVKTVSSMSYFLVILDTKNCIYFHHKRNFHPKEKYKNDHYGDRKSENLRLAGFDQKHLATHNFVQVLSNTRFGAILFLDDNNNMYILDELNLDDKLKPLHCSVSQIFTSYYHCFIKKRSNI